MGELFFGVEVLVFVYYVVMDMVMGYLLVGVVLVVEEFDVVFVEMWCMLFWLCESVYVWWVEYCIVFEVIDFVLVEEEGYVFFVGYVWFEFCLFEIEFDVVLVVVVGDGVVGEVLWLFWICLYVEFNDVFKVELY